MERVNRKYGNSLSTVPTKASCKCTLCGKIFEDIDSFEVHINKSHDFKQSKHSCDVCNKEFIHKLNLDTHIKADHENIQDFKCDKCQSQFGSIVLLKRHIQRVHFGG